MLASTNFAEAEKVGRVVLNAPRTSNDNRVGIIRQLVLKCFAPTRWDSAPYRKSLQPHEEDDQINDEEQDDGGFQDQHSAVGLVVVEKLIQVVEGLEFFVNCPVPVREVEPAGNIFVDAREMQVRVSLRPPSAACPPQ